MLLARVPAQEGRKGLCQDSNRFLGSHGWPAGQQVLDNQDTLGTRSLTGSLGTGLGSGGRRPGARKVKQLEEGRWYGTTGYKPSGLQCRHCL